MNRPVPRSLSSAAFIVAALLVAYLIFSMLSLFIGRGNWPPILVVTVIIFAFGLPFIDKAFGDKLPFLSNWPTTSINARIRRILGLRFFGGDTSFNNSQTGKQVAVNMLWVFSIFLFLLAVVGIRLLIGRPVSVPLANLLATALLGALALAAFQFMALRLNMKHDLKSFFLAIAIYTPIVMLAMGILPVWSALSDDDPFRIPRGLLLSFWSLCLLKSALVALLHNLRKSDAPVPTFTTHPSTSAPK